MELWRYAEGSHKGWRHPLERARIEVDANDPLSSQLEHFRRVVEGEEEPVVDAEDGVKSLAVALAVRESACKRTPVSPSSLLTR